MSKQALVPGALLGSAARPYSPGILAHGLVFVSGQLPVDPATGEMVEGDVHVQTTRVMQNVEAVLGEAGSTFDDVLKVTVYLLRRADWAAMNEAYRAYVGRVPPARCAVVVPEMAPGAAVEIDAIALAGR